MKNVIKFIIIVVIFNISYFLINSLISKPPEFITEELISVLYFLRNTLEWPINIYSLFFSEEFISENVVVLNVVNFAIISLILTKLFYSEDVSDYDDFVKKQKPYILTEYETSNKDKKYNVMPFGKKEIMLDKLGLLKTLSIEREIYYNLSIYLPDEIRKSFSYQVKRIKRMDRFQLAEEPNQAYAFFGFKSILGFGKLKNAFPQWLLEANGNKNEFILATLIFKDVNHKAIFVDVWVKNLKLDKLVYKSNFPIDPNKDYDLSYSSIKVNVSTKKK